MGIIGLQALSPCPIDLGLCPWGHGDHLTNSPPSLIPDYLSSLWHKYPNEWKIIQKKKESANNSGLITPQREWNNNTGRRWIIERARLCVIWVFGRNLTLHPPTGPCLWRLSWFKDLEYVINIETTLFTPQNISPLIHLLWEWLVFLLAKHGTEKSSFSTSQPEMPIQSNNCLSAY